MTVLHFIGIFEAFFLALLLFFKKNKNISHYFLSIYFIVFAISILFDFLETYNAQLNFKYSFLILITPPVTLLHGPVLWFYTKSVTSVHFKLKPKYLLHFLPFLLMLANLSFLIYFQPHEIKIDVVKNEIFKNWINYKIGVLFVTLVMFFYLGWCLRMINKYKEKAPHAFSNIDIETLKWFKVLFFSAVILYGVFVSLNFLDLIFRFMSFKEFQFISFAFGSVFILFLAFYGHQQSNVFSVNYSFSDDTMNFIAQNAYNFNIKDIKTKDFIEKLLNYMNTEKPYLDPNLNVEQLAKQLMVPPFYLSDVLNTKMNTNFLDFVNSHRINEFKTIVSLPGNRNLKIDALAKDAGFNSKATFNRVFKRK